MDLTKEIQRLEKVNESLRTNNRKLNTDLKNKREQVERLKQAEAKVLRTVWWEEKVRVWTVQCFGPEKAYDKKERVHRFVEEALELAQATECTQEEAHELVEYVFGRPVGERGQEMGGTMVTLTALANAWKLNIGLESEKELERTRPQ